jgi:membrane protein implicated in regulation of membrane protease activity
VAQATQDVSEIVRGELALAKSELRVDVRNGALAGGLFGAAGYFLLLASILLAITLGYALVAFGLAPWLAFLVVSLLCLLTAGVLALVGRSRISKVRPPERTIRSTRNLIAAVKPSSQDR